MFVPPCRFSEGSLPPGGSEGEGGDGEVEREETGKTGGEDRTKKTGEEGVNGEKFRGKKQEDGEIVC